MDQGWGWMGYIIHPIPVHPTKFQRASWWSWPCHGAVALSLGSYGPSWDKGRWMERHQFPPDMPQKSKNAEKAWKSDNLWMVPIWLPFHFTENSPPTFKDVGILKNKMGRDPQEESNGWGRSSFWFFPGFWPEFGTWANWWSRKPKLKSLGRVPIANSYVECK